MKLAKVKNLFDGQKKVVTVKEVAESVRCSETYVLELIHKNLLPCYRVGNQYRMILSDVCGCFLKMAANYSPPEVKETR